MAPRKNSKNNSKAPAKKPAARRSRPQYVEPLHKEVVCTYRTIEGNANAIGMTVACRPDTDAGGVTAAPLWSLLSSRYDEYRVKMYVIDIICEQSDRPAFSVIDRIASVMNDPSHFMRDRNHRLHSLTSDNKKVTLMWKAQTSSDNDFRSTEANTVAAAVPSYMHFLQTGLADAAPKVEVRTKCYVEMRGEKKVYPQ